MFVAADKKLHAVNRNGSSLWTYEQTDYLSSSPAISPDGSIVYLASGNGGRLHAINASSGKGVWTFDTGGQIAREQGVSISSNGSTVFVTAYKAYQVHLSRYETRQFYLHAVRASDGTKKWTYELYTHLDPPVTPTTAILSPDDSTLYLGNWDDNLYAVRAYDGKILWKYNAGYQIRRTPSVSADGKTVYVSTNFRLHAVDTINGTARWTYKTTAEISTSPVVSYDTVYFGRNTDKDDLVAVRTSDGTRRWWTSTKEWGSTGKYGIYFSSPAISANGRRLYIGTKAGVLVAFDLHRPLRSPSPSVSSAVTTPSDGKMGEESAADMPRRRILLGCLVLMLAAVALLPEHV